jgi:hypothetical protein
MTPTAWDFRNKLTVILNTAKHSGKPYVDVESGHLHKELGGDSKSHHRLPIFHEVMKKMMRPGDSILQEGRDDGATMLVRYLLNAKQDSLSKNERQDPKSL